MSLLLPLLVLPLLLQEAPAIRVDAEYIKVPVTVLDDQGRTLLGLKREDFRLFDEGESRPISNFVLDRTPIHAVFLLDASGSIREELDQFKYAALRFARTFDKEDRIAIVAFSDGIKVLQDWTNKYKDLKKSLKKLERGYRTALYDALLSTAHDKLEKVPGKKVIILLTDGLDNESVNGYDAVLDTLIESNTVLYIVSRTRLIQSKVASSERVEFLNRVMKNVLSDDKNFVDIYFREKEVSMNYLAESTGGRVFYPARLQALGKSYLQIAQELKSQYVLTFLPPRNSKKRFHALKVQCDRPEAGSIFHREIYRAP